MACFSYDKLFTGLYACPSTLSRQVRLLGIHNDAFTRALIGCCLWNPCMLLKIIFLIPLDVRRWMQTRRHHQLNWSPIEVRFYLSSVDPNIYIHRLTNFLMNLWELGQCRADHVIRTIFLHIQDRLVFKFHNYWLQSHIKATWSGMFSALAPCFLGIGNVHAHTAGSIPGSSWLET